jgi:formyltetrahydrofolate deformylase
MMGRSFCSLQDVTYLSHQKNVEQLIKRGRDPEMAVFARAVDLYVNRRILVDGKRTIVFD